MCPALELFGIPGIPEIKRGDDIAGIILESAKKGHITIEDGDILVVTQKIVSKA